MIDSLLDALVLWLKEKGFCCERDFSEDKPYFVEESCIYLGLKSLEVESSGLGDYLGMKKTEGEAYAEVFGKRLRAVLSFNLVSPYSLGQESHMKEQGKLWEALAYPPEYLKVLGLSLGETKKENGIQAFVTSGELNILGFFEAIRETEDQGEFLDFILKGVIKQ